MVRKKNLSTEDHEEVMSYENRKPNIVSINDIPIKFKCLTETQKKFAELIQTKDIVFATGPAGTGKSYVALAEALKLMKTEPKYEKLILVKSVQPLENEEIGFMPGNLMDKLMLPYFSFTITLDKIFKSSSTTKMLIIKEIIKFLPAAYLRGTDISNSILVLDETQNIDMHTFKTIITRIGHDSKFIILGDTDQCDMHHKSSSCLKTVSELFQNRDFAGSVFFTEEDCVRNPLIPKILELLKTVE